MKAGPLATGHDPPRTKPRGGWSRATESGCGGGAAEAGGQRWASATERTAWPGVRASARSASQRPAVSPPAHSGCTPPGRSRRGRGTGRRWTCLETGRQEDNAVTRATRTTAGHSQPSAPRPEVPFATPCTAAPRLAASGTPWWVCACRGGAGDRPGADTDGCRRTGWTRAKTPGTPGDRRHAWGRSRELNNPPQRHPGLCCSEWHHAPTR